MPRGSLVHRAPAVGRVLRHMRTHVHPPKFSYEFPRVVVLVPTQRPALSWWDRFRHEHRSIPLRSSRRLGQKGLHQKPVAILHQYMSHIAQLRLASAGLGVHPSIRIGSRFMGLVLSLFSAKVDIFARFGRLPGPVLGSETLVTCPSLDQCPVHCEMLIRHVRLGSLQHPLEKRLPYLFLQQSLSILALPPVIPYRPVHLHTHKPPQQPVVLQLFDQHSFAAYRIED